MRCCDQEMTTPFCPMCGKQITIEDSIDGLLDYIEIIIASNKEEMEKIKDLHRLRALHQGESYGSEIDRNSRAQMVMESLHRCQTWEAELVELIDKAVKWDKHLEESDDVG